MQVGIFEEEECDCTTMLAQNPATSRAMSMDCAICQLEGLGTDTGSNYNSERAIFLVTLNLPSLQEP